VNDFCSDGFTRQPLLIIANRSLATFFCCPGSILFEIKLFLFAKNKPFKVSYLIGNTTKADKECALKIPNYLIYTLF